MAGSQGTPEERARELLHMRGLVARALSLDGLSEEERAFLSFAAEQAAATLDALAAAGVDLDVLTGGPAAPRAGPPT